MIEIIIPLLFILLGFAAMVADLAIIYTIFRFRRLHSPFNIFLANWAISDLVSIILVPINYVMVLGYSRSKKLDCIFMQAALILHVTEILFGIILALDCCFAAYFHRTSERFRNRYRYVIASIWILSLLFYILSTALCITFTIYSVAMILFAIFYSISIVIVIALLLSKLAQKCKLIGTTYPKPFTLRLTLVSIIIFSYLFAFISMLLTFVEMFYHFSNYFVISVVTSVCAVLSSSVLTLILLCWLNYDFRQSLFQLRKPAHEQFDNDTSENEDSVKNAPKICFHSSTQDIMTNGHQDVVS